MATWRSTATRWSGAQQYPQHVLSTLRVNGVGHEYSPHSILEHAGVRAVLPKLSSVRYSMSRFTSSGLSLATWSATAAAASARHSTAAFILQEFEERRRCIFDVWMYV